VVYVVHEGLNADIRATLDRRAERVLVDLSFSRSAIAEELELRKVQELEIELAQLDIARITATASLKVGRGALLGGVFSKTAGASACVVYVKAAAIRRLTSTKPGNK